MSSVNKVILVGRLGGDPELRHTTENRAVATFTMATSEVWKDGRSGEKKEKTEWHNIKIWGKLGEIAAQYLKKGKLVFIEGRLETREYEGRDGIKRRIVEIVATDMKMLGNAGGSLQDRDDRAAPRSFRQTDDFPPEEDDVPL